MLRSSWLKGRLCQHGDVRLRAPERDRWRLLRKKRYSILEEQTFLCVWESNVATEIDRAVNLTAVWCVCVAGVHAAEWGEMDCCNALLFHGSASIEPHSIRLIHVYEHGHCPHTELCPSGLVWGCVTEVAFFSFFSWWYSAALWQIWGGERSGVLLHEWMSPHTHIGQCAY